MLYFPWKVGYKVTPELKNRIILYDSKLIAEQIGSGDDYDVIKKVISIVITDEPLIPGSQRYFHRFTFYDVEAGVELSDIIEIYTLELVKLPEGADGTELYDWAKFIAADTEEELNMVAERNPQVAQAVVRLRELSADERARDLYERREKARRDQSSRERWALKQQAIAIARNLLKMNLPIEQIITATGLTKEEIENMMALTD